jgi:thioredoxin 1
MNKIDWHDFDPQGYETTKAVVVEFFTDWSGSAFIIAQLLYQLEEYYNHYFEFIMVNVEESEKIRAQYGIKKIPTILFFKDGMVINQLEGTQSRSTIKDVLDEIIEQIEKSQR